MKALLKQALKETKALIDTLEQIANLEAKDGITIPERLAVVDRIHAERAYLKGLQEWLA